MIVQKGQLFRKVKSSDRLAPWPAATVLFIAHGEFPVLFIAHGEFQILFIACDPLDDSR